MRPLHRLYHFTTPYHFEQGWAVRAWIPARMRIPARAVRSEPATDRGLVPDAPARRVPLRRTAMAALTGVFCALVPALSQADARQGEARIENPVGATGPRAAGALDLPPAPPLVQLPTQSEWSGWTPACRAAVKQLAKAARYMGDRAISAGATELAMLRFIQDWGIRLDRIRQDDPSEALRPRINRSLPMPLCRASALAALCDDLTDVFAPVAELEPAGTVPPEDAP